MLTVKKRGKGRTRNHQPEKQKWGQKTRPRRKRVGWLYLRTIWRQWGNEWLRYL